MNFTFLGLADNAEGHLDGSISGVDTTITLQTGEGSLFPETINGSATSGGDANTLNCTGIQALGVEVGMLIENLTDGSQAFVESVSTNSITTTTLVGGAGNTWDNSDEWAIGRFVVTVNQRESDYAPMTQYEKVLIKQRTGDTLTVSERGYGTTSAQTFVAGDYVSLYVTEDQIENCYNAIAQNALDIYDLQENKADVSYVDAALASRNWKTAVRVASTANVTLASGVENGDTIDGVVLATGDRVLLKDQSSGAENGIYIVAASGAPTRATDFDAASEVETALIPVEAGTSNADTVWMCTNDAPTIDVTALTFVQFAPSTSIASQSEAEAGSNNTKLMTPLRVAQAITYQQNFQAVAGEVITYTGTPILVYISDGTGGRTVGRFYRADGNDTTNFAQGGLAFVKETTAIGTTYTLYKGRVDGFTGLTENRVYFASDTVGTIDTTPGTTVVPIGKSFSTTAIDMDAPLHMKMAQGELTSVDDTTSGSSNHDETINLGFYPVFIEIDYYIQGHDAATATSSYFRESGRALWKGTSIVNNAIYGTGTSGTDNLTAATFSYAPGTADATNPVVGTNGGTTQETQTTLSINAVSASGFTVRTAVSSGSGGYNGRMRGRYRAWGY